MATPKNEIKKDVETKVETSVGEAKPAKEVMTMELPKEVVEKVETPSTETKSEEKSTEKKVENKTPTEESSKEDESSREDVKIISENEWTEEDQKHLSERAQKRIRDLNEKANKAKELETELTMLRSQKQDDRFTKPLEDSKQPLFEPKFDLKKYPSLGETPSIENQPIVEQNNLPQYEERVLSPEEYEKDVYNTADILVQARIKEYQKGLEIKEDLKKMESKYPELNPSSDEYSDDLSRKLGTLFETQLKAKTDAKLGDFIDSIMSMREEKATTYAKKVKSNLSARTIEQKAEEAISPHEVEPEPIKPYEELSLEEKETYLKEKGLWN